MVQKELVLAFSAQPGNGLGSFSSPPAPCPPVTYSDISESKAGSWPLVLRLPLTHLLTSGACSSCLENGQRGAKFVIGAPLWLTLLLCKMGTHMPVFISLINKKQLIVIVTIIIIASNLANC